MAFHSFHPRRVALAYDCREDTFTIELYLSIVIVPVPLDGREEGTIIKYLIVSAFLTRIERKYQQ